MKLTSSLLSAGVGAAMVLCLSGCGGDIGQGIGSIFQPSPALTSLSPASGHVGDTITITGTNLRFDGSPFQVTFNGVKSTNVQGASDNVLQAQVPTGATSGPVVVTNTDKFVNGQLDASNPLPFTVD